MKIKRTILPDQPGTKYWIEKYGKDLVCVRYRYDEKLNKKITTVEIIVDEKSWQIRQYDASVLFQSFCLKIFEKPGISIATLVLYLHWDIFYLRHKAGKQFQNPAPNLFCAAFLPLAVVGLMSHLKFPAK